MTTDNSPTSLSSDEQARQFQQMIAHARSTAVFLMNPKGIITSWNAAAEAMKGYSPDEAIGQFLGLLYTNDDKARGWPEHNLAEAAKNGSYEEEAWRRRKDGSLFCAHIEITALTGDDGKLLGFAKMTRDNSAVEAIRRQLTVEKIRAETTLHSIGDGVITTDREGRIDFMNAAAERLTGFSCSEARGKTVPDVFVLLDESTMGRLMDPAMQCLKEGRPTDIGAHALLVSRNGQRHAIEDSASPIRLPDGSITGAVVVFHDVSENRRNLHHVTHQAAHDALTGLVNRREFETRLQRAIEHAQETKSPGAVLYMDLDQFKIVNDTCGHAAGDELLRQLARNYRTLVRDRDTLARLGGDEFALLIERGTLKEATGVAHKILEATRNFRYVCKERSFQIGVSIGLVMIGSETGDLAEVLQRADHACYIAKESGRNRVYIQTHQDVDVVARRSDMEWAARLAEAIHDNKLVLFHQPIVPVSNLPNGHSHYEVLVRLHDNNEGPISPERFLTAAERFDLMPSLDRWVLSHVLDWLETHPEHLAALNLCSINISGRTLADESFHQFVLDRLDESIVPANKLCFEITETAAVANFTKTVAFIRQLKSRGCQISLDDFGTGMASFSYLKQLPVDFIKIDGSFITAMMESPVDLEMVKSIKDIGHIMGKKIVAECVKGQATMDQLAQLGVDFAQGYWLGEPKPLPV